MSCNCIEHCTTCIDILKRKLEQLQIQQKIPQCLFQFSSSSSSLFEVLPPARASSCTPPPPCLGSQLPQVRTWQNITVTMQRKLPIFTLNIPWWTPPFLALLSAVQRWTQTCCSGEPKFTLVISSLVDNIIGTSASKVNQSSLPSWPVMIPDLLEYTN